MVRKLNESEFSDFALGRVLGKLNEVRRLCNAIKVEASGLDDLIAQKVEDVDTLDRVEWQLDKALANLKKADSNIGSI